MEWMSFWEDLFGKEIVEDVRDLQNEWDNIMRDARDDFRGILHDARDGFREVVDEIVPPDSDFGKVIHEVRKQSDRNEDMLVNMGDAAKNLFYDEYDAEEKSRFELADHLFIRLWPYTHHAIYVGRKHVIHYNMDDDLTVSICRASLSQFAQGQKIYCMKESRSPLKYSRREAVRRAEARIGESRYNLVANNCENFVRWCRSGGPQWVWE